VCVYHWDALGMDVIEWNGCMATTETGFLPPKNECFASMKN
jgi:hypothetical protein